MSNIQKVIDLCNRGFDEYTDRYYDRIDDLLSTEEQTESIVRARKLAKVGPSLVSPRFAYPHIKSALKSTPSPT